MVQEFSRKCSRSMTFFPGDIKNHLEMFKIYSVHVEKDISHLWTVAGVRDFQYGAIQVPLSCSGFSVILAPLLSYPPTPSYWHGWLQAWGTPLSMVWSFVLKDRNDFSFSNRDLKANF